MDNGIQNTFFALMAVVGGLSLLLYFIKKFVNKSKKLKGIAGLEVLSRTSLSPKNHLYIVRAEGKTLLIGATDNNIQTLADLSNKTNRAYNSSNLNNSTTIPRKTTAGAMSAIAKKYQSQTSATSKQPIKTASTTSSDDLSFISFLKSTLNQTAKKN